MEHDEHTNAEEQVGKDGFEHSLFERHATQVPLWQYGVEENRLQSEFEAHDEHKLLELHLEAVIAGHSVFEVHPIQVPEGQKGLAT